MATTSFLAPDEPPPYEVVCAEGTSPFVIAVDHASRLIPRALGTLGVAPDELVRHIAWDIGAAALARALSTRLDAFLILQSYSRLAIDMNRPPRTAHSIVTRSERTDISGNRDLTLSEIEARERALFWPYHERIAQELDRRAEAGRPTALLALHSFTPRYMDVDRRLQVGALFHRDPRLSRALLAQLAEDPHLALAENEPYTMTDEDDYTVPVHGERRGLLHLELEIRQDLLADDVGVAAWADRLARALPLALSECFRRESCA